MNIPSLALGLAALVAASTTQFQPLSSLRRCIGFSVAGTYIVWAGLSLLAWPELLPLAFPFLFLLVPTWGAGLLPFLTEPLQFGFVVLAAGALAARLGTQRFRGNAIITFLVALVLNIAFIAATLNSANFKAQREIAAAAIALKPVCIQQASFVESLLHLGNPFHPHALIRLADGSQYYWSYRKQAFFKGNESLDPNFPCTPAPH